ncbi:MAG: hypothetical protein DRK00_04705, partial [Thermoprotei archaeon]
MTPLFVEARADVRLLSNLALLLVGLAITAYIRNLKETEELTIETGSLLLTVSKRDGSWRVLHKPAGITWSSREGELCRLELRNRRTGEVRTFVVNSFKEVVKRGDSIVLTYSPVEGVEVEFTIKALDDETISLSYSVVGTSSEWILERVRILDEAPRVDEGYAVIPKGMGYAVLPGADVKLESPATYTPGYYMRFLGLVRGTRVVGRGRSAVVITWSSPDVGISLHSKKVEGRYVLAPSLTLSRGAREVRLHFILNGGFVEIAKYYRSVVKREGLLVPLTAKMKGELLRELVGSVHVMIPCKFALSKEAPESAIKFYRSLGIPIDRGESVVYWRFEEIPRVAEHLKEVTKVDRVYFNIFGWMHGGHDMYYPDYLPADEELGGNTGLSQACNKLSQLGYLFSLYVNPILHFESAPSANLSEAVMLPDGRRHVINYWAGGRGYIVCPRQIMKYLRRVLPRIKDLFSPNVGYIDYMMAVPLPECHDPSHPCTREEAIECFREVMKYFNSMFGVVGAEMPYEFATPYLHIYFGWLTFYRMKGVVPIPITELVYRECGIFWTWMGNLVSAYKPKELIPRRESLVDFVSVGRPACIYIPPHLYYEAEREGAYRVDNMYARGDNGWGEGLCPTDRLIKNAYEVTSPLSEITFDDEMVDYEFLTPDYRVHKTVFSDGTVVVTNCREGGADFNYNGVIIPPQGFLVESPTFIAFCAKSYNGVN